MKTLFRNRLYLAVSLGHFTNDVFASAGPVLVTFLSIPMALTGAQIGLAIGAFQFFSALSQPFFGWLADRTGSRWLGPGSVAWIITFMSIALVVAQQTNHYIWFLIFYLVASLGSGAFHPLGTKHATEESGERAAAGAAIFFLFGQSGLASGPALAGVILGTIGLAGIYGLAFLAIPVVIYMVVAMQHTGIQPVDENSHTVSPQATQTKVQWGAIVLLAVLVGLRSWTTIGTVSFLPKMFQAMGWSPSAYGAITGAFWMSSAIFGVFAGTWADRWGRRQVIFATLLIGSITLFFLPMYDTWVAFLLAILTGGLLGASHSIIVVIAQSLLPGRPAMASGIILGYLFGVGAIATWAIGWLADSWGLDAVIQAGAILTIISAVLALFLPATREQLQTRVEGVPA
jgi:FSR family fosmidomycin resistance protein-like MFS transporter